MKILTVSPLKAATAYLVVLILMTAIGAHAQGAFNRYSNARYGFGIDYPAHFHRGEAPINNDGRSFTSGDGATLDVYGINNVMDETLSSTYQAVLDDKGRSVAYKARGLNWFVVSWTSSGRIFYQKQFVGTGSMNAFIISYPKSRRAAYASIVERLERSFRPGDLSQSH